MAQDIPLAGTTFRKGGIDLPDFRLALFRQLDRIGMLFSEVVTNMQNAGQQKKFLDISRVSAVEMLEAMLAPYWEYDKDYKADQERIKNDPEDTADDYKYARDKFMALIRLMGRKRFLPEEDIIVDEGFDEVESK